MTIHINTNTNFPLTINGKTKWMTFESLGILDQVKIIRQAIENKRKLRSNPKHINVLSFKKNNRPFIFGEIIGVDVSDLNCAKLRFTLAGVNIFSVDLDSLKLAN